MFIPMPDYIDLFRSHYAAWKLGGNFKYYDVTLGQVSTSMSVG